MISEPDYDSLYKTANNPHLLINRYSLSLRQTLLSLRSQYNTDTKAAGKVDQ